jgi:hypothetical protein
VAGGDASRLLDRYPPAPAKGNELSYRATVDGYRDPLAPFNPAKHFTDAIAQIPNRN